MKNEPRGARARKKPTKENGTGLKEDVEEAVKMSGEEVKDTFNEWLNICDKAAEKGE